MRHWNKFADYIKGARLEFKKVNWPSRRDTVRFTLIVMAITIGVAIFLGFLDFIFASLLNLLI